MKRFFKLFVPVTAIIIVAAVAWYFFYWLKTPQHSVTLIIDAVKQHDVNTFEKHVDMNSVYGRAYDDLVTVTFGEETHNNPIIVSIVKSLKPFAIPLLANETRNYVKTGKFMDTAATQEAGGGANSGTDIVESLKNKTGVRDLRYKGIADTDVNGDSADLGLILHDSSTEQDLRLNVKMVKTDDDLWQLNEVSNLKEFIEARKAGEAKMLAKLNQPLQTRLAEAAEIKQLGIKKSSVHYSSLIQLLEAEINIRNTSNKNIIYLAGNIELYNDTDELFYVAGFAGNKVLPINSAANYKFDWELNPYIKEDSLIINSNLNNIKWKIYLTGIRFDDATTLELLTEIPAKK